MTAIRKQFWSLVHRMPCSIVHRACSLCREEDMCPKCGARVFNEAAANGLWFTVDPIATTSTGGSTGTIRKR